MQAEDLSEVHALLHAGVITVPCLIAIKHCLATTNTPIESRMGKKQGIMVLTSKYIETFDPRPDRSAVQVLYPLPAYTQECDAAVTGRFSRETGMVFDAAA